jgi:hypothetical protein
MLKHITDFIDDAIKELVISPYIVLEGNIVTTSTHE